ncbi:hypothetical protein EOD41_08995 [Mucilaginibacter limnophilus]|uniref:Uncharacterized protein n=1 Tax=Mucilaginibacter limnophilus TaxID=1932778 RepID=A0A3S2Y2P5_9SPHI|nr:hypothetical protein [Mucilaginibacter limnophilus]RVU02074.1 hypothetical protein EOD41_08995 [Mucilaginibacter limnophilus]
MMIFSSKFNRGTAKVCEDLLSAFCRRAKICSYFLLLDAARTIIVYGPTGMRLHIFSLETGDFLRQVGELHIFGKDHGEWLAFQMQGWNGGKTNFH